MLFVAGMVNLVNAQTDSVMVEDENSVHEVHFVKQIMDRGVTNIVEAYQNYIQGADTKSPHHYLIYNIMWIENGEEHLKTILFFGEYRAKVFSNIKFDKFEQTMDFYHENKIASIDTKLFVDNHIDLWSSEIEGYLIKVREGDDIKLISLASSELENKEEDLTVQFVNGLLKQLKKSQSEVKSYISKTYPIKEKKFK